MNVVIFVSGIDTDAGKTYATGFLASSYMRQGKKVATVKFIQTGCDGYSDDIETHRKIMGVDLPEDSEGLTAPIIFTYPASAQLAARLDGKNIDLSKIDSAIDELRKKYDVVLIEGAGGLMVPITDDFFSIDYPLSRNLPVALVTNSVLGSINHTVLSLEALASRGMTVHSVLYNTYFDKDPVIAADTQEFIKRYIEKKIPDTQWIEVPVWRNEEGFII